jgi:endonuclease YncB( thermonuclease family)
MFILSRIAVIAKASAIFTCIVAAAAAAGDISGIPRIVDGDTVQIAATKIRLSGIDAPETDQLCLDAKALRWTCGIAARDELVRHAGDRPWTFHVTGTDRYGRSLASCEVGGENIEQWMVRSGWALSFVRYSHLYDADEEAARGARSGIWQARSSHLGTGEAEILKPWFSVPPAFRRTPKQFCLARPRRRKHPRRTVPSRATSAAAASAYIISKADGGTPGSIWTRAKGKGGFARCRRPKPQAAVLRKTSINVFGRGDAAIVFRVTAESGHCRMQSALRIVPILLQKSFCVTEYNFSGL